MDGPLEGYVRAEVDLPEQMAKAAAAAGIDLSRLLEETLRRELRRQRMEGAEPRRDPDAAQVERELDGFNSWIAAHGGSIADDYRPF